MDLIRYFRFFLKKKPGAAILTNSLPNNPSECVRHLRSKGEWNRPPAFRRQHAGFSSPVLCFDAPPPEYSFLNKRLRLFFLLAWKQGIFYQTREDRRVTFHSGQLTQPRSFKPLNHFLPPWPPHYCTVSFLSSANFSMEMMKNFKLKGSGN